MDSANKNGIITSISLFISRLITVDDRFSSFRSMNCLRAFFHTDTHVHPPLSSAPTFLIPEYTLHCRHCFPVRHTTWKTVGAALHSRYVGSDNSQKLSNPNVFTSFLNRTINHFTRTDVPRDLKTLHFARTKWSFSKHLPLPQTTVTDW